MDTFHPHTKEKFRLKKIGKRIREIKNDLELKGVWPEVNGLPASTLQKQLALMKYIFRHRHIAYCLNRGKTVAQIESGNPIKGKSWDLINVFRMELYEQTIQYYRNMVEDLIDDSKKKDRDVIRFHLVKHLWELYIEDDERDIYDSTIALIDAMNFMIYGPQILNIEPIGHDNKISGLLVEMEANDIPDRLVMDLLDAEDYMMPEAEDMDDLLDELDALDAMYLAEGMSPDMPEDEDIIELTDEVVFIGSDEGIIISVIKCACCGNTRSFCECPDFCLPECAVCHQGNGNCICDIIPEGYCSGACHVCTDSSPCADIPKSNCPYQDYYITEYTCKLKNGPAKCCFYNKDWRTCSVYIKHIDEDCPFEGKYPDRTDMDIPCSIRGVCDFFGRNFHDCETYKTRDPESHNLKC